MSNDISGAQRAIRRQKAATQVQAKQVLDQQSNIGVDGDERQAVVEGQQMSQVVRNAQHEALATTWPDHYKHVIRLWNDHLHTIWPKLAIVSMFGEAEHLSPRWRWSNIMDREGNAIQSSDMLDFPSVHDANEHRTFWTTMYGTCAQWCWEHMKRMTDYDFDGPPTENRVRIAVPKTRGSALLTCVEQWGGYNVEIWAVMDDEMPRAWDIKRVDIGSPLPDDDEIHFDDTEVVSRFRRYIPINEAEKKAYAAASAAYWDDQREAKVSMNKAVLTNKAGTHLGIPGHRRLDPPNDDDEAVIEEEATASEDGDGNELLHSLLESHERNAIQVEQGNALPPDPIDLADEAIIDGDRRASEDDGHWPTQDQQETEDREFLERLRRLVTLPPLPE